jgi:hypothetical protein
LNPSATFPAGFLDFKMHRFSDDATKKGCETHKRFHLLCRSKLFVSVPNFDKLRNLVWYGGISQFYSISPISCAMLWRVRNSRTRPGTRRASLSCNLFSGGSNEEIQQ